MIAHKGFLISFEGGEGAGKTVQTKRLVENFQKLNKPITALREPGGTAISEQIRSVVLSAKNEGISYTSEVLLFQAARAQIYFEKVLPALEAGETVVMDRTRDSSVVYQGIVRKFGRDLIDQLNTISTKDTYPDMTFLLDVPAALGLERCNLAGNGNRFELEGLEFHEGVRQAYLMLANEDTTGRWIIVDASRSLEEVEAELWEKIQKKLKSL